MHKATAFALILLVACTAIVSAASVDRHAVSIVIHHFSTIQYLKIKRED